MQWQCMKAKYITNAFIGIKRVSNNENSLID